MNLEARRKTWHSNFAGFRIFQDGKKVIEHINALREEEALEKAEHIMHQRNGISKDSWCKACVA